MTAKVNNLSDATIAISHIVASINKSNETNPYTVINTIECATSVAKFYVNETNPYMVINTIEYATSVAEFYVNNKVMKRSAEPLLQLLKTLQKIFVPGLYTALDNAVNDLENYIKEITVSEADTAVPGGDKVAQTAASAAAVIGELNKTEEDINVEVADKLTKFITEMNKYFPDLPKEVLLTCIELDDGFASGIKINIPENVGPTKFIEAAQHVLTKIFDIKEDEPGTEETCSSPVRCKCHLLKSIREITIKHYIEVDKSSGLSERRKILGKQLIDAVVKHDAEDFEDLFNKVIVLATHYDIVRTNSAYLQDVFSAVTEFIG